MEHPAGRGTHATFDYEHEFALGHDEYILATSGVVFILGCIGEDPPDDRWLLLAETIESLPATD